MSNGEHTKGIASAPMTQLPDDLIRAAGPIRLMLGAAPDGHSITVGLLFRATPPIGAVEFMLDGPQLDALHAQLHDLVTLSPAEIAALRARLHGTTDTK